MADRKNYTLALCEMLRESTATPAEALDEAVANAKEQGVRLEKYLIDNDVCTRDDVTLAVADYLNIPPISLSHFTPNPQLIELIPRETLTRHLAFPVARVGRNLTIALGDPFDIFAMEDLKTLTGLHVTPVVAAERDVIEALERCFPDEFEGADIEDILKEADEDLEIGHEKVDDDAGDESIEAMLESAEGAPVIRMVNMMLLEALRTGASDIHLEPQEKLLRLRYRIDGALLERPGPPKHLQGAVLSRMKLMSGMDIAERRIPQDGRIKIRALGKEIDLRVNTLPTVFGEKVVMRILDKSALFPNLAALGLDAQAHTAMKLAVGHPHGIVLVTGPTGSGKTTTLYSCLMELNQPDVNIITCEDPVEYQLPGINQVQINSYVGMSFAAALRSILRQDPDIILIGETRDGETAEIGIKAALTGHLVLSTLHTNDAAGSVTRMIDMGVEPSLLASSLILAQAQRLVRKLCPACKRKTDKLPMEKLEAYEVDPAFFDDTSELYEAVGCPRCHNSGYKGRIAIMEVLPITPPLRQDITNGVSSKEIGAKAEADGMLTLKSIGMAKAKEGLTSIEAALQVTGGGE